ncbi:DUF742 domain-containing protein [Amycolatopsis sp. NPDC051071]|uniref:DUF742 domain-containing protein n=1 Tax=Amycolatopsis sp. NPDC051071 TaxID=3154637 RepID=UPI003444AC35
MTEPDDTTRDLVRRAHQADPQPPDFDVAAGLADLRARAALDTPFDAAVQRNFPHSASPGAEPLLSKGSADVDFDDFAAAGALVRPYAITGGRGRNTQEIRVEALVSTVRNRQDRVTELPEYQRITRLCARPTALAEIAATLHLPIGVTRVLVSDLADRGVLHIQPPDDHDDGGPAPATLERVLQGLRTLGQPARPAR